MSHVHRPPGEPTVGHLALAKWHLDRYDRLRASTASRAAIVLSAGALLSAGNAVVLTQLIGGPSRPVGTWTITAFSLGLVISACLVMMALVSAAGVLVTLKDSRTLFTQETSLPDAPFFNGPDTVRLMASFDAFYSASLVQTEEQILEAAHVELWIVIRQHRHRYEKLRNSVRTLRWAGIAFLAVFLGLIVKNLIVHL
jgi:uncharacterized membrane protein